jgi:predicted ATP-grasp superfamily ATP-dependent carboligase
MRVFVFEFVTGGGYAGRPIVAGLAGEGDMMLAALVRDLVALDGVEVAICRDRRLPRPELPVQVQWVDGDWAGAWSMGLRDCDAVIPIAPETGGVLERLTRDAEQIGRPLFNSRSAAVAVAASKRATLARLAAAGLPVVACWDAHCLPPPGDGSRVVKPDDGVGCDGVRLLAGGHAVERFLHEQADGRDWLVQPYVDGQPASLSLLAGTDRVCLLGCNLQRIAQCDDRLVLLGCVVNGLAEQAPALLPLAHRLVRAIPGLWGYVGVDLVLTATGPVILEVNPRLTTSYVGLSRSIGRNVAGMLLDLARDPARLPRNHLPGQSVHVDVGAGGVA